MTDEYILVKVLNLLTKLILLIHSTSSSMLFDSLCMLTMVLRTFFKTQSVCDVDVIIYDRGVAAV